MAGTLITVVEVDPFPATARKAELTEDEREAITVFVAESPETGEVIPDTGGLRKLRWSGKGKGKSGGYRVIYYLFDRRNPVYLLAIYPKNKRVNLTPEEKKRLARLAKGLKTEAKARRQVQTRRRTR
jgi:mRNA-degrading endonuclease RelE of RelBE toxin-antitoxin system